GAWHWHSPERLGLLALGYRRVLLCELFCPTCGDWRGAIEQEQESYPCPSCQQPCKAAICCDRAFTRRKFIAWERICGPVNIHIKRDWSEELFPQSRRRQFGDRHSGTPNGIWVARR